MLKTMDEQWVIQQLCVCPTDHMERRNGLMSGKKMLYGKVAAFLGSGLYGGCNR